MLTNVPPPAASATTPLISGAVVLAGRSSRWVDWWLRARGEPFRWSASAGEPAVMLARQGLTVRERWRPAGLADGALAEGEAIGVAEAAGGARP